MQNTVKQWTSGPTLIEGCRPESFELESGRVALRWPELENLTADGGILRNRR
jgi:hypothetical protein